MPTPTTTGTVAEGGVIDVDQVTAHPLNPRRDVGDITDLAASIQAKGLLEPIVVAPWPADLPTGRGRKKPAVVLIAGHRRLAAAKHAGITQLPARVLDHLTTSAAQIEAMLIENLQRADLTAMEEADGYQALLDLDIPDQAIADSVGFPVRRVRERIKLGKLPAAAKTKLHAGAITLADALALLEFTGNTAATKELTKTIGTKNFAWALETQRRRARENAQHNKDLDAVRKAGITIAKTAPAGAKRVASIDYAGRDEVGLIPRSAGLGDSTKRLAWILKNHAKCPGALAVEQQVAYGGGRKEIAHYCTQPKLHPKPKVVKTATEIATAKAEKEAKAAAMEAIDVARTLRRRHLTERIPRVDDKRAKALILDLFVDTTVYLHDPPATYGFLLDLAGVPMPEPAKGNRTVHAADIKAAVLPALQKLPLPALVALLWAHTERGGESALTEVNPYGWGRDRARSYLHQLQEHFEFEPSDYEAARFLADPAEAAEARGA